MESWRQIWAASNLQRSAAVDACAGHGHARSLYSGSRARERVNAIVKAVLLSPIPVQYPPHSLPSIQIALSSARLVGGVSLFQSRLCKTPTDDDDAAKNHLVVF